MKRLGIVLMVVGVLLLVAAISLVFYNTREEMQAEKASEEYLEKLIQLIPDSTNTTDSNQFGDDESSSLPEDMPEYSRPEMKYFDNMAVVELDGYEFVGYISIPKLNLQLPVMSQTEKHLLKISPCRLSGSPMAENLVIGAHNYNRHFGRIGELSQGDEVLFADMEGTVWRYKVVFNETLEPNSVDYLTEGEYPLTLYTCVYGGEKRVTVRLERAE